MSKNSKRKKVPSSSLKKVLVITYYWPPAGGSGVQRWLKFAKYFREFGWEPVIYTAEKPEVPVFDESLLKDVPEGIEVIKSEVPEPFKLYRKITGKKADEPVSLVVDLKKKSLVQRMAMFVRANWFIPDAKMWWIRPSLRILKKRLKQGDIQAIVSTGPPHTCHVIGMKLKEKFPNIPWLADFRDPWIKIDFFEEFNLTKFAFNRHKTLEQKVVESADSVVVIGNSLKKDFDDYTPKKIKVITNGFDEESQIGKAVTLDEKFTLSHIGIYSKTRHHPMLLEVVAELKNETRDFAEHFKLQLVGQVDEAVKRQVKDLQLENLVEFKSFVSHEEVGLIQRASRMLYLSINQVANAKGILTGKIFEYMNSGRPILLIGPPDGDAADLLKDQENIWVVPFGEKEQLKSAIETQFNRFRAHQDVTVERSVNQYSRKSLTGEITKLLDQLTA